jgi:hypothetical protein
MYEKVEDLGEFWATTDRFGESRVTEKFAPTMKARMAGALIEKWGMVACDPASGEDRAGRARLRLLKPGEVVDRACETADIAIDRMHELGWFTAMPAPQEKSK